MPDPALHDPMAHQAPGHAGEINTAEMPIACDYIDVVRLNEGQPRFLFQPHLSGGRALASFTLEIEGARGLLQHLGHLVQEQGSS